MKSSTKILLIIAGTCLILGAVFCGIYFMKNGTSDFTAYTQNFEKVEMTFDTVPKGVRFSDVSRGIRIIESEDDKVHLACYKSENTRYNVKEKDGILDIAYHEDALLLSFGPVNTPLESCVLALPKAFDGSLKVDAVSSHVVIMGIGQQDKGDMDVSTVSGSVQILACGGADVSVCTTSGDIRLGAVRCSELSVDTISGKTEGEDLYTRKCSVESTSGDVTLDRLSSRDIEVDTVAGDVDLAVFENEGFRIETSTVSGKISVPKSKGSMEMELSTTSGDIKVTFITE